MPAAWHMYLSAACNWKGREVARKWKLEAGKSSVCREHAHGNWQLNGQTNESPGSANANANVAIWDCKQFYELASNNLRNFIDT